ncbi:hypothetical protein DL98DRAFT_566879 [Cadophora sp. DSE1049]|nr:hypothetical protein DL98DRAFT_566879 [Cadophora sp. DSE1049]
MANPPFSMFYSSKDTPDKGRGLFAKQNLPIGFQLFEDEPLFTARQMSAVAEHYRSKQPLAWTGDCLSGSSKRFPGHWVPRARSLQKKSCANESRQRDCLPDSGPHESLADYDVAERWLRDEIYDGRLSKAIEDAFLITAGQRDVRRAKIFAKWLIRRQIICFGSDSPEVQKTERMLSSPDDFSHTGASTDWVNYANDIPLQDTPFEAHMWLWRVDDPTLLPEARWCLLAFYFPGELNAAENARVENLGRRYEDLESRLRAERTQNANQSLLHKYQIIWKKGKGLRGVMRTASEVDMIERCLTTSTQRDQEQETLVD